MTTVIADQEQHVRERFEQDTANHRMRVFRDDGLYRHLRFSERGTWRYGYDLITWPGMLVIAGDCGDFMFSRVSDMFTFFRGDRINPDYWRQKITNPDMRDGTRRYSRDRFVPRVMEWYRDRVEYEPDEDCSLAAALNEQVINWGPPDSRYEAIERLQGFEYHGARLISEPWEFDFDEYDWQFLWCCWGIVQGIAQYDWTKGWT